MRRRLTVFVLIFAAFSIAYSSATFYILSQKPSQPFLALGVFSPEGVLSGYSSGTIVSITANQVQNWYLQVTNRMESVQYVRIVYRLGNATTPNPTSIQPSPTSCIIELVAPHNCLYADTFIPNGNTASLNFTWTILSENQTGAITHLNLSINGRQFSSPVGASLGRNFRFIFELWTYDFPSNSFQYGWQSPLSRVGPWLQVWFNTS